MFPALPLPLPLERTSGPVQNLMLAQLTVETADVAKFLLYTPLLVELSTELINQCLATKLSTPVIATILQKISRKKKLLTDR